MMLRIPLVLLLSIIPMHAMDKGADEQEPVRDEIAKKAKELRTWSSEEMKEKIKELEARRVYLEEKQARFRFDLQSTNSLYSREDLLACLSWVYSNQATMRKELCGLLAGSEGIIKDEYKPEFQNMLKRLNDDLNRGLNI